MCNLFPNGSKKSQEIYSEYTLEKTYDFFPLAKGWQPTCPLRAAPYPSAVPGTSFDCACTVVKITGPPYQTLRNTMLKRLAVLCLLAVPLAGLSAHADTIGPNCGSCFGSTYTLTETATSNPNVFDIKLVVDTSAYTGTSTNFLNAVSVKVVSQTSDITSVSVISAPTSFGTDVMSGGLNAGGCSGNGGGFFCLEGPGNGVPVAGPGDIYSFNFMVTLTDPASLLTAFDAASVKALYLTANGQQNGITSEPITLQPGTTSPVPEPGTFALLGTGILAAAFTTKKLSS